VEGTPLAPVGQSMVPGRGEAANTGCAVSTKATPETITMLTVINQPIQNPLRRISQISSGDSAFNHNLAPGLPSFQS